MPYLITQIRVQITQIKTKEVQDAKMKPEFSLVIPFYNEEENAERVCLEIVNEFDSRELDYELIAVNNGCADRTPGILRRLSEKHSRIKVVDVEKNQGYGFGVIQGFQHARGGYVGYSTGDGQISASDVFGVFSRMKEQGLDYAQGKRVRKDTFLRRLNTKVFNFVFHACFPANVYDIGSNPKIMKRGIFERISPVSKDWFIDGEIILKSYLLKGRMDEFPVAFRKREKGRSHIKLSSVFEMLKNIARWKLRTLFTKVV